MYIFLALIFLGIHSGKTEKKDSSLSKEKEVSLSHKKEGFVNIEEVNQLCTVLQKVSKKLEESGALLEAQFRKAQEKLSQESNQLRSLEASLSQKEFQNKKMQLEKKVQDFQRMAMNKNEELKKRYDDATKEFQHKVIAILSRLGKKYSLSKIYPQGALLWVSKDEILDLTKELLDILNQEWTEWKDEAHNKKVLRKEG